MAGMPRARYCAARPLAAEAVRWLLTSVRGHRRRRASQRVRMLQIDSFERTWRSPASQGLHGACGRAGRRRRRRAGLVDGRPVCAARIRCSCQHSIRSLPTTCGSISCSFEEALMSGHSKWAAPSSTRRAPPTRHGESLFAKLIRQVEAAARQGGGDPEMNPTLRHDVPEGPRQLGTPRHDRTGHQARQRRARGRHLRDRSLRGLRAAGVAVLIDALHRQPQPHRIRTSAACSPSAWFSSMAEPGAVAGSSNDEA